MIYQGNLHNHETKGKGKNRYKNEGEKWKNKANKRQVPFELSNCSEEN